MATHTNFGGGSDVRNFRIGRENGHLNKNGIPHFFEWLRELPVNAGKDRKFETRKDDERTTHFELFRALDGYLSKIEVGDKVIEGKSRKFLYLSLVDGLEVYRIEVGDVDGRYSIDIMRRLLDTRFDPALKLRLAPFAIENGGRYTIGLSAMSGTDGKLIAAYKDFHTKEVVNPRLEGSPEPTSTIFKGETHWDFIPVAVWLYKELQAHVMPKLSATPEPAPAPQPAAPAQTNIRTNHAATNEGFSTTRPEPAPNAFDVPVGGIGDDLPF